MSTGAGQRIRKLRVAAGLTQRELALAVGLDNTVLSLIENGYRAPSDATVAAIRKHLLSVITRNYEYATREEIAATA